MRDLNKQETKLYLSWYQGFIFGFEDGYNHRPSNSQERWRKDIGFFKKRRINKSQFFKGYDYGITEVAAVIDKKWDEVNPDIWKEWWKQHWLYHYVYSKKEEK